MQLNLVKKELAVPNDQARPESIVSLWKVRTAGLAAPCYRNDRPRCLRMMMASISIISKDGTPIDAKKINMSDLIRVEEPFFRALRIYADEFKSEVAVGKTLGDISDIDLYARVNAFGRRKFELDLQISKNRII